MTKLDFSDRLTPYEEAWRLQKALVSDLVPGGGAHEDVAGFLLLVQHPPVYTLGLEEVIIRALNEVSGLTGERIPGLTGVWVRGQKVAAIGVRAQKWVTYHGLAINITTDLAPFRYITPCGIADRPVASVEVSSTV
ncbi:hypothetical protein WJX75_005320 [Coccomyxa subellipsoidea]|uniref:lipoyl(octanoyl) transferase n=1 Tax=Coccomyxa subellipsoidea TaxID=248742 RepID=A0ABR2YTG0_9CHLO